MQKHECLHCLVKELIEYTVDHTHRPPFDILADICAAVGEGVANWEDEETRHEVIEMLGDYMTTAMEKEVESYPGGLSLRAFDTSIATKH